MTRLRHFPTASLLPAARSLMLLALLVLLGGASTTAQAQIFEPEGLNMPGTWNSWINPPTNNLALASFTQVPGGRLAPITTGVRRWQTIFSVDEAGADVVGGSYVWLFTSGPANSPYNNKWAGVSVAMNSLQAYTFQVGADNTITLTNGRWYTMNWRDNGYAATSAIFMETSAEPVHLLPVLGVPEAPVAANQPLEVTVRLAGPKSPEERVYVRYSTDNLTTSDVVEVTSFNSNHEGTATLPGQPQGTTVTFYVLTTTVAATSWGGQADMHTIRFENNGGANYSYDVGAIMTVAPGDWSNPGTWNFGSAPPEGVNVTLNHAVTLDVPATVGQLTISGTGSLNGGSQTLTVGAGGGIVNDGTLSGADGTVAFAGTGTVSGSGTTTFNRVTLSGGVNLGGATVSGEFVMLAGGFVSGGTPVYADGSTLVYQTGGEYGVGSEWVSNASSGAGVPYNVEIVSSAFNFQNSSNPRTVRNNVTIQPGGGLTLSTNVGGDLRVGGDFSESGTFNANNRAVIFIGGQDQSVLSDDETLAIPFVIKEGAGTLTLEVPLSVSGGLTLSGGTIDAVEPLTVTGPLTVDGEASLEGAVQPLAAVTIASAGRLNRTGVLSFTSNLVINGEGSIGPDVTQVRFIGGSNAFIGGTTELLVLPALQVEVGAALFLARPAQVGSITVASGGLVIEGPTNVLANVLVAEGASLELRENTNDSLIGSLAVSGSIQVDGSLTLAGPAGGDLSVGGDLIVNGALDARERAVSFSGGAAQTVSGSVERLDLPFVLKTGAGVLTVDVPVRLDGRLFLNEGSIEAGASAFTFVTRTTGPDSTGAVARIGVIDFNGGDLVGAHRFERRYPLEQAGWRFIAAPVAGAPFASLNAAFQTQGYPWSDFPNADPTLFRYDDDFLPVTGTDFVPGEGYLFYMFDSESASTLPATWAVTGAPNAPATYGLDSDFLLAGNPFPSYLDWREVFEASDNVGANYWIWDPATGGTGGDIGGYVAFNAATNVGDGGPRIAPFQGFFVEAEGGVPQLTFAYEHVDNEASPVFVGRPERAATPAPHVRLDLAGEGLGARAWAVRWADGTDGPDAGDALALGSLDADHALLWLEDADGRSLLMDARADELSVATYHLGVATTRPGAYTLAWPDLAETAPATWSLRLTDAVTGQTVNLRETPSYAFTVSEARLLAGGPETASAPAFAGDRTPDTRFTLVVAPQGVATEAPVEEALAFGFGGVYPNPAVDRATVRFATETAGPVRLAVYDLLGRRVAVLAEGDRAAGTHVEALDTRALASGTYLVRLEAEGRVAAVRLTVAR